MTQINNLDSIKRDITTAYFNNLSNLKYDVPQDLNDTIVGYFEKITMTKDSARALAGALIHTANAQNIDPMIILHKFMTMQGTELTAYLAMFLNLNRINTSMLGVSNAPMANKYIARTIIS